MSAKKGEILNNCRIVGLPIGTRLDPITKWETITILKDTQNEGVWVQAKPKLPEAEVVNVSGNTGRRRSENI